MYKNTRYYLFLFSILILSLATGCGGRKNPPAPKDSQEPIVSGKAGAKASGDSDEKEAAPAPKDSQEPIVSGKAGAGARDDTKTGAGGDTDPPGSFKNDSAKGGDGHDLDTTKHLAGTSPRGLPEQPLDEYTDTGEGKGAKAREDSDKHKAAALGAKEAMPSEGLPITSYPLRREAGAGDDTSSLDSFTDDDAAKGGDTPTTSAVLDRSSRFISDWKEIGRLDHAPPAVRELFPGGKPYLYKRGQKLWNTIKASVQEGGRISSTIIDQVDQLIAAATVLTSKKSEELSEEFVKDIFIEKLGGEGVDLATIPADTQRVISVVKGILAEASKPAEVSEESPAQPGDKQKLQAEAELAEKMIEYLDLLEKFITDT